jgi:hypothetical protein
VTLRVVVLFAILALPLFPQAKPSRVTVPFVGCESDGQMGPMPPPKGQPVALNITAESARQLAYYKAEEGEGVLAPLGWHCFGTYGSNGASVYVSPEPVGSKDFFGKNWHGFSGPAVQLSYKYGDTSGRFEVAAYIARLFPDRMSFVNDVIAEGIEPAESFVKGPYPADRLTYKGKDLVEYETPARAEGLGVHSSLRESDEAIRGMVSIGGDAANAEFLAVRLPKNLAALTRVIIQHVESGDSEGK